MIYLKTICAIFCHWCYLTLSILKVFMKYYFSIFFSTCSESYRKIMILQKIRRLFCLKRSDQEIKQPSKQQELICPVASKMQNGHMAIKSIIISQTAEIHGACGKAFRPSLTISPRHRPVTTTHPSQMHSTTFIHGLKCRTTHLHKNCPHLPTTRHSVCLQPT